MGEGLGDERKRKVESTEVSDSKRSNTEYSSFSQGMMVSGLLICCFTCLKIIL